jgi:hypothetical protein
MNTLRDALQPILSQPTPDALIALRGALLISGQQGEALDCALEVTGNFYAYLSELQSKITAQQYSELASMLDIGAVGAVAMENILFGGEDHFWRRLILGSIGESLMVAASRQYIKGWQVETSLVHTNAAWYLTEALWRASSEMQPDLGPEKRWQAIKALLAPAYDPEVDAPQKAVLLGRVFQILLLTYLARLLPDS